MNSKQKKTYFLSAVVIETALYEGRVFQRRFYNGNFEKRLAVKDVKRTAKKAKALHEALVAKEIGKIKCEEGVKRKDYFNESPFWQTKLSLDCARKLWS